MFVYVRESLFLSPARVLINTVNTQGVMGKGIAKTFRDVFPDMYRVYRQHCEDGSFDIGRLLIYPTLHKTILNFPTKTHWRQPSRVEYIERGLQTFVDQYARMGITSVAFPQLGCGNGGLDWDVQVHPVMRRYLEPLPIDVYIHLPRREDAPLEPERWSDDRIAHRLRGTPRHVPFGELWNEYLQVIASVDRLAPDLNGWDVGYDDGSLEPMLWWRRGDECVAMAQGQVLDLLQIALRVGLLGLRDFPEAFAPVAPAFLALLDRCSAFERANWAIDPADIDSVASEGLMYVPPVESESSVKQQALFDAIAAA